MAELTTMGIGKPHVGHTFEFADLKKAVKLFQSGQTIGKVVVKL